MLLRRLAQTPLLCLVLVWTTTLVAVVDAAPKISAEILNFTPPCAQECFRSFILTNLESSACGDAPSLACLCRQSGKTGHTIGEGAVACIAAEANRGVCTGADGNLQAQSTSYNMCVGITNAAPRTHSTIVATLIVPTGTGPLVVPTPRPTTPSSSSSSSRSLPAQDVTSILTPTSAAPTASISSTVGSSPVTPRPSDTSAAVVPERTPTASAQQLSPAQITGIVLGCLAVVVFGILLVILARCIRRKRFGRDVETGFTKMRDSISFGRRSHPNSPPEIQISKPLQSSPSDRAYQWPAPPPRPVQPQQVQQPMGVGLTMSPYRTQQAASDVAAMRAAQRTPTVVLSPPPPMASSAKVENTSTPKPTLTLAIPQAPKPQIRAPANARESIVTEFAEDGEGDSLPNTGNIWRPPPTDPQSATTYYFADKGGNWILRSKSDRKSGLPPRGPAREPPVATTEVELPSADDKTKAERAQGFFSPGVIPQPLRVPSRENQMKLGSPIAFKDQQQLQAPSRRDNRSSSVYSPYSAPLSMVPGPQNPLPATTLPHPDTYFAMIRDGRELAGQRSSGRKSTRRAGKRRSADSTTSIESAAALPFVDEAVIEDEPQINLSPVVESPKTPLTPGQSPVAYPKIRRRDAASPPGRQNPYDFQQFPMPARQASLRQGPTPNLTVPTKRVISPASRPVDPRRPKGPGAPFLSPDHNPATYRTGSPETRQGAIPSMETLEQRQRYQQQEMARYWGGEQVGTQRRGPSPQRQPYELPTDTPKRLVPALQQQERRPSPANQQLQPQQQERRPSPANLPPRQQEQERHPSPATVTSSQATRSMSRSPADSASSLLAKRRGADKVAALTLADQEARRNGKKKGWKKEEMEMPPITPGIRMMTPTRKGDDLFLDVAR